MVEWCFRRSELGTEALAYLRNSHGFGFYVIGPALSDVLAEMIMNESLDELGMTGERVKGEDW
jgi:hypothetical protein